MLRGTGRMAGFHALAIGARGPHPDRGIRRSRRENVLRNGSAALGATSLMRPTSRTIATTGIPPSSAPNVIAR